MEGNGSRAAPRMRTRDSLITERLVTGPSGYGYRIRRLKGSQVLAAHGGIFDLGSMASETIGGKASPEMVARAEANIERTVLAALVEPKLEDAAEVWGLGAEEAKFLYLQALDLAGAGVEAAEAIRPFSEAATPSSGTMISPAGTEGAPPTSPATA